jgi:hypothetical protein
MSWATFSFVFLAADAYYIYAVGGLERLSNNIEKDAGPELQGPCIGLE